MSGSGISWAICKSAPRSGQTATPAPDHSVFCRPDTLPAAQSTASKHRLIDQTDWPRGVVLKRNGGTPETRLRQRKSYTAFQYVTSCNSGLTFARMSVQKSGGVGDASPLSKKVRERRPPRPRPTTPLSGLPYCMSRKRGHFFAYL